MLKKQFSVLSTALTLLAGMSVSQSAVASEPFIGEIKMVGFNFAPRGFAFCDGQPLSISQNPALFSLLGTAFGGNGRTTFQLPDLRGRVAVHPGNGPGLSSYQWGERGGLERVTLTTAEMPAHNHIASTTTIVAATLKGTDVEGNSATPSGNSLASKRRTNIYSADAPDVDLHVGSITATATATTTVNNNGGSQAHENRAPFLGVYHVIALQGLFPARA
jgi:microcystin-dependent protein